MCHNQRVYVLHQNALHAAPKMHADERKKKSIEKINRSFLDSQLYFIGLYVYHFVCIIFFFKCIFHKVFIYLNF